MLELLKKFVSQDDPRKYMRSPFTRGEWTYATNGHIAVRVPKIDGVEILPEKHIPALESLFQSVGGNGFIALPWMPPLEECLLCSGTGIAYECPECDGEGEFEHGTHSYCCKECGGSGQVEYGSAGVSACRHCGGTGAKRNAPAKVGGSHFDLFYLHLINGLPEAKFSPGGDRMDMARFVFDGGEGILMPMRAED